VPAGAAATYDEADDGAGHRVTSRVRV
jgi:hypothetical protein